MGSNTERVSIHNPTGAPIKENLATTCSPLKGLICGPMEKATKEIGWKAR